MDLWEIAWKVDSSGSGYGPVVGCCEHGNEPSRSMKGGNFLNFLVTIGFSRRTLLHGVSYVVIFGYETGGHRYITSLLSVHFMHFMQRISKNKN